MITVYPILRQQMRKHNTTIKDLAVLTGENIISIYLKMWGIKRWKLTEAVKICCFFHHQDVEHLFSKRGCSFCSEIL